MKAISTSVLVALALPKQAEAQTATASSNQANNIWNMFGQSATPATPGVPGTDPFSQMMAHGTNVMNSMATQPTATAGTQAAGQMFDPFKMMNDMNTAAQQANQHMTNMGNTMATMHQHVANAQQAFDSMSQMPMQMMQQAQQHMTNAHAAVTQGMQQANDVMTATHEGFRDMMTPRSMQMQGAPISRSCPPTYECFGDVGFATCSGVQGGATCIGGEMLPFPRSGVCSCTNAAEVCSPMPTADWFSNAQCTTPEAANKQGNATIVNPSASEEAMKANGVSTDPNSCVNRCKSGYEPSMPCQCNDNCQDHDNCCSDKISACSVTTTSAAPIAPIVVDGTVPPNPLGTTLGPQAYDWVPGIAQGTVTSSSRLYDANMAVAVPIRKGPSAKLCMAWTIVLLTYTVLGFAVVRVVSFARRRLSGEASQTHESLLVHGHDEELGPVE